MLILFKHIFRNIRENKFRSVLIIISLALSTMVMFLNLTIKDDIATKYTSVLQGAFQKFDLEVYSNKTDSDGYFKKEDLDLTSVNTQHILYTASSFGVFMKGEESLTVNFIGSDRQLLQESNLCSLSEKSVDYNDKDDTQIIVSKKTADKFAWRLNDEVTIFTQDGEKKLTITGIANTSGLYLAEFDTFELMTTLNFAARCAAKEGYISTAYLDLNTDADLEKTVTQLENANSEYVARILVDEDSIAKALTTINQLLMIILFLVIGLNFYIIASITKLIMATRIPVVGTFRSLGATKAKMNFILILENAVFGVFGAFLGIGFGILARSPLSDTFLSMGDAGDYVTFNLGFKLSYVVIAVCFSVGLQILISLSSILKASRRSIKDNIFNTLSTQAKQSKKKTLLGFFFLLVSILIYKLNNKYLFSLGTLALVAAIIGAVLILPMLTAYLSRLFSCFFGKLFGGPASLGMKNVSSSKTIRSSITLITIGLALILMVAAAVNSLNSMFTGFEKAAKYDIELNGLSKQAEEYSYIGDLEGVEQLAFRYTNYIEGTLNKKATQFLMFGTDTFAMGLKGDEGLLTSLTDQEIVVDEYYALKNDIEVGDDLTLESHDFKNDKKTYRVVGFMDSSAYSTNRNILLVTESEYKNQFGSIPSIIEVYTNQDNIKVKEMLIKELAGTGITVQTLSEYLDLQKESNQGILDMVTIILGLSVVLAIFGLINNQMIGFIQRKREYAVLYSVSMSRSQLRSMIFFESLGTFLTGCTFAILLGLWLMKLLYVMLMAIGMGYPINMDFFTLLQIVGIVLLTLLVTTISPLRKVTKIDIVSEIKYE